MSLSNASPHRFLCEADLEGLGIFVAAVVGVVDLGTGSGEWTSRKDLLLREAGSSDNRRLDEDIVRSRRIASDVH